MSNKTKTKARRPLTKERVLRAAVRLADEGAIESLSMRKLGQELGVEAMSLYNHVANKDEVLDGIVAMVVSEIAPLSDEADWKTALRQNAISTHEVLMRHPWAANLWWRRGEGPDRMQIADSTLRRLREAGFSEDLTYHGYHVLLGHVLGFTLQALNFPIETKEELAEMAAQFLEDFPVDEYPHLAEHIRHHVDPGESNEGAFEFGLDLILDGLERLRDADA
jgi:AcrR family transcriptional regulator